MMFLPSVLCRERLGSGTVIYGSQNLSFQVFLEFRVALKEWSGERVEGGGSDEERVRGQERSEARMRAIFHSGR